MVLAVLNHLLDGLCRVDHRLLIGNKIGVVDIVALNVNA